MRYTKEQKKWIKQYKFLTGFDPLLGDYEAGNESFPEAVNKSVQWFEDWSSGMFLMLTNLDVPK